MLQKVDIIGNIVWDAELKTNRSGKEFIAFRVAVNEGTGENRRTTYYDVSCPKSGILEKLTKGRHVFVSGKLSLSTALKDGQVYLNAYVGAKDIVIGSNQNS